MLFGKKDREPVQRENKGQSPAMTHCPSCGHPINSLAVTCPACGCEMISSGTAFTVHGLVDKLSEIENRRESIIKGIFRSLNGNLPDKLTQKVETIKNYPIPNTKKDIFELVHLAASNINARIYIAKEPGEVNLNYEDFKAQKLLIQTWSDKMESAFKKAQALFGNDPDFSKVADIYRAKKTEIEILCKKKKNKKTLTIACTIVVVVAIVAALVVFVYLPHNEREKKLETIAAEVRADIESGNYESALIKGNQLHMDDGVSDDSDRKWNKEREGYIALIKEKTQSEAADKTVSVDDTTQEPTNELQNETDQTGIQETEPQKELSPEEIGSLLETIPNEYLPADVGSSGEYALLLSFAKKDGKLTDDQVSALMSMVQGNSKENTYAFMKKGSKGTRSYIVIALDINKASKTHTGTSSQTKYGNVRVSEDSAIRISWDDGGSSLFFIEETNEGKHSLLNSSKKDTGYIEVDSAPASRMYVKKKVKTEDEKYVLLTDPDNASVGSLVRFGHYPQTLEEGDNSDIVWVVVQKDGNKALLLSEKLLALKAFHGKKINISWGKSDLRKWLNGEFKNKAFTKEEQKAIIAIKRDGASDTVSLLSLSEAEDIFVPYSERYTASESSKALTSHIQAAYTDYVYMVSKELDISIGGVETSQIWRNTPWWLCTVNSSDKKQVYYTGNYGLVVDRDTSICTNAEYGVRPIISLDLSKAEIYVLNED